VQRGEEPLKVFVIAEAGINHNGELKLAKKLVDAAKDAGADCIKFQPLFQKILRQKRFKGRVPEANKSEESQYDMLKRYELSFDEFSELSRYCQDKNIEFLSTAFDFESIEFLKSLDMKRWKIPSGEITNLPYLIKIAKLNKPVILSTA